MNKDNSEVRVLRAEIVISEVLKRGVSVSLALMVAGTLLCFLRDGDYGRGAGDAADLSRLFARGATFPRTLAWLGDGLMHLRGQAVIVAGLMLLIATPVIRVMVATVMFIVEKDRRYAAITLTVLVLLMVSFLMDGAE